MTTISGCDSYQHIRQGAGDSKIVFYSPSISSYNEKLRVATHEIGHLWGIDDLYTVNTNLDSIYSKTSCTTATRHDLNALRIGLNNLWYDPGTGDVWSYQESPNVFHLRADVNFDGSITASDARLILRYASQLETFTTVQRRLADVNEDGSVTSADARLVLQYASKEISCFPADE